LSVTHLKGAVKQKGYLVVRNGTLLVEPFRYRHPYHCRSIIRSQCQSLLYQSPFGIKAIGEAFLSSDLFRLLADWKIFGSMPCSGVGTNLMITHQKYGYARR
jgi:hypothetical protein